MKRSDTALESLPIHFLNLLCHVPQPRCLKSQANAVLTRHHDSNSRIGVYYISLSWHAVEN